MRWLITFSMLVCCAALHGAWLKCDYGGYESITGLRVRVGTNSGIYSVTNDVGFTNSVLVSRLRTFPGVTNYFVWSAYWPWGESEFSDEVFTNIAVYLPSPQVTNVVLRVPSGKFYVERADSPSVWLSPNVVNGPTNISFATVGTMGFFRWRPYFLTVASPKSGASMLMATKKPIFTATVKPIPISPTTNALIDLKQINLDPSKALR